MRPLLRYLSCFFVLICAAYGIYTFVRPATSSAPPPVHRDTLIIRDTLRISRPVPVREEVVRYSPQLDSIEVYPRTLIVRQTAPPAAKPRRWSMGVQAGYGLTPKGLQPYVGVGVSIRLF